MGSRYAVSCNTLPHFPADLHLREEECDYELDEHLTHILQIFLHLQRNDFKEGQKNFLLFIHRRAFRKLNFRVRDFLTRWGKSPFNILLSVMSGIERDLTLSRTFEVTLPGLGHSLICMKVLKASESKSEDSKATAQSYPVDSHNVRNWVEFFQHVFDQLNKSLSSNCPPGPEETKLIVTIMQVLCGVKNIIKYIFGTS